jgi:hypothetical protein
MNDTQIKTRHGLILQGIAAAAFTEAGFSYEADVQYDPTCERPDFLIPNSTKPKYIVEVHQTDVRNSLAMKTLRAFIAVAESKATFGAELVSVNLIFGDPDFDFSSSPLSAISAIYDLNVFPARDQAAKRALQKLEKSSMVLAGDATYTTRKAIEEICDKNSASVATFAATLKSALAGAKARLELKPLWKAEQQRQHALGPIPIAGQATYYKRMMLAALFFEDSDFDQLVNGAPNGEWPVSVVPQLLRVGLARIEEEVDGDHVIVREEFVAFLKDHRTPHLRALCKDVLDSVSDMHWFFEDIRDERRRTAMSKIFLDALRSGRLDFQRELVASLTTDNYRGLQHARGWFIDLASVATHRSFNYYNKEIFQDPRYPLSLWNAFSNLAIRSPALIGKPARIAALGEIVADKVFQSMHQSGMAPLDMNEAELSAGLLAFRVSSAIKLRKLNPLVIAAASVISEHGLSIGRVNIDSLLFDLAEDSGVGRFLVFVVSDSISKKSVLLSVVAVHEGNGDHKSKEWGTRRIASLYRYIDGHVKASGLNEGLFVMDGEWEDKDIARLYRSGWNHICRLGELEVKLTSIFGPKRKAAASVSKKTILQIADSGDDA